MQRSLLMHHCSDPKCDFKIGHQKLDQILSQPKKRYVEPDRSGWDIKSNNEKENYDDESTD